MAQEFRRCEFGSEEWEKLTEDGYETVSVSERDRKMMALMRREKSEEDATPEPTSPI